MFFGLGVHERSDAADGPSYIQQGNSRKEIKLSGCISFSIKVAMPWAEVKNGI